MKLSELLIIAASGRRRPGERVQLPRLHLVVPAGERIFFLFLATSSIHLPEAIWAFVRFSVKIAIRADHADLF